MIDQDVLNALTPFVEALEKLGLAYHIGGSVASTTWGIPRTTIDVDVVTHLETEQISTLIEQLEDTYYIVREMIADAIERGAAFNIIHSSAIKIDVFVPKMSPRTTTEMQRSRQRAIDSEAAGKLFWVASPEDIILRKLEWYSLGGGVSERQWLDVLGVLKVQAAALDFAYMSEWATKLGIADLLGKAMEDAGLSSCE